VITNPSEDTKVRITRVIYEPTRSGLVLSIYEDGLGERGIAVCVVLEFIEFEEVNVFLGGDVRLLTTPFRLLGGNELSYVSINKLTFSNIFRRANTCSALVK
jgi:hypothetical protein